MTILFEGNPLPPIRSIMPESWLAISAIAFFGCILPYVLWHRLLMRYCVDEVMPFTVLIPVVGVILSIIELGESVTPGLIIGGSILTFGLIIIVFAGRWPQRQTSAIPR